MFNVSLTSTYQNQSRLYQTLNDLITNQTVLPDNIFLQLSEHPYLKDTGFSNKIITDKNLLNLLEDNKDLIVVNWVDNIGPYRKLIYTIEDFWESEIPIITIDDDHTYNENLFKNLIHDFEIYNMSCNYRGFTLNLNDINSFNYENRIKPTQKISIYNFSTGASGAIFSSKFFKKTNKLLLDKNIFLNLCNTADDIWYNLIRMANQENLYLDSKPWLRKDNSNHRDGLYFNYNKKNNDNLGKKVIKYLIENNHTL